MFLPQECPLLAQSGHPASDFQCPLLGVKRTLPKRPPMSAFDPKRTLAARICRDAQCRPQHGRVRPSAGGQPVRRRDFIRLVGGVTAGWPLAARAQQPTMPVIGFLSVGTAETMSDYVAAFHRGLADGGFVEGRDVVIEYRW